MPSRRWCPGGGGYSHSVKAPDGERGGFACSPQFRWGADGARGQLALNVFQLRRGILGMGKGCRLREQGRLTGATARCFGLLCPAGRCQLMSVENVTPSAVDAGREDHGACSSDLSTCAIWAHRHRVSASRLWRAKKSWPLPPGCRGDSCGAIRTRTHIYMSARRRCRAPCRCGPQRRFAPAAVTPGTILDLRKGPVRQRSRWQGAKETEGGVTKQMCWPSHVVATQRRQRRGLRVLAIRPLGPSIPEGLDCSSLQTPLAVRSSIHLRSAGMNLAYPSRTTGSCLWQLPLTWWAPNRAPGTGNDRRCP
jgi:hypothetical protein